MSDSTGCGSLLNVVFTSTSPGSPSTYSWDFGNGQTSASNSATINFSTPGSYTISLSVDGGPATTKTVNVFNNPSADFIADTLKGCSGMEVTFSDASILGDAGIDSYTWGFGDGAISTNASPKHEFTYINDGFFNISLSVTDSNGCSKSITKDNYIQVTNQPVVDILSPHRIGCTAPHTAAFDLTATGAADAENPFTYAWDFGDGSPIETTEDPTHIFDSLGSYDVQVTVTDTANCPRFLNYSNYIQIVEYEAAFTASDTVLCKGIEFNITNNSSSIGDVEYKWLFGNGDSSETINPAYTYGDTGTYTLTLIAADKQFTCPDTATQEIRVESITISFTADTLYSCEVPFDVTLSSTSDKDPTLWEWNSGTLSSTDENPTLTYTSDGIFTIRAIGTDANGCKDTSQLADSVEIATPVAEFTMDTSSGCIPLGIQFTDASTGKDPINAWDWTFGDGNTGNGQNASNTYVADGEYTVTLSITNDLGCQDSKDTIVMSGTPPTAAYTLPNDTVCALTWFDAEDQSTNEETWDWSVFKNITPSYSFTYGSSYEDPLIYLDADTGYWHIELIAGNKGCFDTIMDSNAIYVLGPVTRIDTPDFNCDSNLFVQFTDTTLDPGNWHWDFGTGSADDTSNLQHPSFTFPTTDTFWVSLTSTKGQCTGTDSFRVITTIPVSDFTYDSTVRCAPVGVLFDTTLIEQANLMGWDYGNGNKGGVEISHTFTSPGTFDVEMYVSDIHGCIDTTMKQVMVAGIEANILVDTTTGCVPFEVTFRDSSVSDSTIATWLWDFDANDIGNFVDDTAMAKNPPAFTYNEEGSFRVTLTVYTEDSSCSRTTTEYITATKPNASYVVVNTSELQICSGETVTYLNRTTPSSISHLFDYKWVFGDGDTLTEKDPTKTFIGDTLTFKDTVYNNYLIATDTNGCVDTSRLDDYYANIEVHNPKAVFENVGDSSGCPIDFIGMFQSQVTSESIVEYNWTFGEGSVAIIDSPSIQYTVPGIYPVRLYVETDEGCFDSLRIDSAIRVAGGYATVEHDLTGVGCRPEEVTFTISNLFNVAGIQWNYSPDSVTSILPNTTTSTTYTYTVAGKYVPSVNIHNPSTDEFSCAVPIEFDTIYIEDVQARMSIDTNQGCTPFTPVFTDASLLAASSAWLFSDGDTITDSLPTGKAFIHNGFGADDSVTVQLVVASENGCTDVTDSMIFVHPLPEVSIAETDTICAGSDIELTGIGIGDSVYWYNRNNNFITNNTSMVATVSPDSTETYVFVLIDSFSCVDSASVIQPVVESFEMEVLRPTTTDTSVHIGDTVFMQANAFNNKDSVYFKWTQNTDFIPCITCDSATVQPLETTTYIITASNYTNGEVCFTESKEIVVTVDEKTTIAAPQAFTPGVEGEDGIFRIRGWGIKEILEFSIYNRWGVKIWESTTSDPNEGWDGTVDGKIQNVDSYVYIVRAIVYDSETGEEELEAMEGTIILLQ